MERGHFTREEAHVFEADRPVLATAGFQSTSLDDLRAEFPLLRFEQPEARGVEPELRRVAEGAYAVSRLPSPAGEPRLRWVQLHEPAAVSEGDVLLNTVDKERGD